MKTKEVCVYKGVLESHVYIYNKRRSFCGV